MRTLSTGEKHPLAESTAVLKHTLPELNLQSFYSIRIRGDYVGILGRTKASNELAVWSWKTGVQNLRVSIVCTHVTIQVTNLLVRHGGFIQVAILCVSRQQFHLRIFMDTTCAVGLSSREETSSRHDTYQHTFSALLAWSYFTGLQAALSYTTSPGSVTRMATQCGAGTIPHRWGRADDRNVLTIFRLSGRPDVPDTRESPS